jgi:hypothetical protein
MMSLSEFDLVGYDDVLEVGVAFATASLADMVNGHCLLCCTVLGVYEHSELSARDTRSVA